MRERERERERGRETQPEKLRDLRDREKEETQETTIETTPTTFHGSQALQLLAPTPYLPNLPYSVLAHLTLRAYLIISYLTYTVRR
jgi:hypothetical protein